MKLTDADLYNAARASVALDALVADKNLTGLAYYYEGRPDSVTREAVSSLIVGNSILNAQGIPMCGEFDLKTCIAMLILTGSASVAALRSFIRLILRRTLSWWDDGPHHLRHCGGQADSAQLKKYHGKPGSGASVEFKLKRGRSPCWASRRRRTVRLSL